MAQLAIELRVSRTTAVAEVRHAEVDDQIAATSSMVEILKNFNISTLTAPADSDFELRPDNMSNSAQEAGKMFHCPVMSTLRAHAPAPAAHQVQRR